MIWSRKPERSTRPMRPRRCEILQHCRNNFDNRLNCWRGLRGPKEIKDVPAQN